MKPGTETTKGNDEDDIELFVEKETVDFLMGFVVVVFVSPTICTGCDLLLYFDTLFSIGSSISMRWVLLDCGSMSPSLENKVECLLISELKILTLRSSL